MCQDLELIDENFVEREVNIRFNLSMQTTVDELKFDTCYEMSLIEFHECIARYAEIASLAPVSATKFELIKKWATYTKRFKLPLHIKMESFMRRMYEKGKMSEF